MSDIVTFKFKPSAVALAQLLDDPFDILEGIAKDEVARGVEVGLLPREVLLFDPVAGPRDIEVHAAHVQAAHLRFRR
jgi:hypothetical protein